VGTGPASPYFLSARRTESETGKKRIFRAQGSALGIYRPCLRPGNIKIPKSEEDWILLTARCWRRECARVEANRPGQSLSLVLDGQEVARSPFDERLG
jgi:hypothetical protein